MTKKSATILVYPYPWSSERLKHKDVFLFPSAVAKALGVPLLTQTSWLVTGEELEGQSPLVLRMALLLNCLIALPRLVRVRFKAEAKNPCLIFFHIGWPTALLAIFSRCLWGRRAYILVKTDLNPNSALVTCGAGSFLEYFSVRVLRRMANLLTVETEAATLLLRRIIKGPAQVLHCRNGIDIPSSLLHSLQRKTDVLVVSRFSVEKKGAALYAKVIPEIVRAGFRVHLIGDGAEEFMRQVFPHTVGQVEISEQLTHAAVLHAMRDARVFLSLSLSESFLIAIMEAYAMGCLIVSTPVGVAPELARETANVKITSFHPDQILDQLMVAITQEQPPIPHNINGWDNVVEKSGLIPLVCNQ